MAVTTPPGLKQARGPVLGLPHLLQLRFHPIEHNEFLRESYGEVYRLNVFGVRLYVTAGADMAEQVLVNRDRTFANGPAWSHFIGPFFHRGIMLLDFDEHLHHRRILQHAFTNDALRSYHSVMAPHIRRNLAEWDGVEQPARLHHLFKALTLDLALETFVGCRARRRAAGRGQQGVHRRGARRHLHRPEAGAGHSLGQGPEGTGVPGGLLPLPPAGEAARRSQTRWEP